MTGVVQAGLGQLKVKEQPLWADGDAAPSLTLANYGD